MTDASRVDPRGPRHGSAAGRAFLQAAIGGHRSACGNHCCDLYAAKVRIIQL
jgi:hypothetical protein